MSGIGSGRLENPSAKLTVETCYTFKVETFGGTVALICWNLGWRGIVVDFWPCR